MRVRTAWLGVVAAVLGAAAAPAGEESPSVDEIVAKTNRVAYYQGQDGRARVTMTITDDQGRRRGREFVILRRDAEPPADEAGRYGKDEYCADQKLYVYFERPADVEKMAFLVWKHTGAGQEDDRWLYMPALDLVKRIAASDERTSFVGSQFFYEDVSGRGVSEDTHELMETSKNYFVLKNTPVDPKRVEFAYYKMWIHRATFLPVKIEYYNAQDEKYREYSVLAVQTIQGYTTVTKAEMKDLQTGGGTVIEYGDVRYDTGLPEDVFTERYLRNPPMDQLK